jgi:hypothetical protein
MTDERTRHAIALLMVRLHEIAVELRPYVDEVNDAFSQTLSSEHPGQMSDELHRHFWGLQEAMDSIQDAILELGVLIK